MSFFWHYLDILVVYLCTKNLEDLRFVFTTECELTTFWRQSFKQDGEVQLKLPGYIFDQ